MESVMDFRDYEDFTDTVSIYPGAGSLSGLSYSGLGLGEAGEVQNQLKKVIRDDAGIVSDSRKEKIIDELGDLLFYVARVAKDLGVSLGVVAQRNIIKLESRKERGKIVGDGDNR